jgi:hypothetical protein
MAGLARGGWPGQGTVMAAKPGVAIRENQASIS